MGDLGVKCKACGFVFPCSVGPDGQPEFHTNVYGKICPRCCSFIPPPCEPAFVVENRRRREELIFQFRQSIRERYLKNQGALNADFKRRGEAQH